MTTKSVQFDIPLDLWKRLRLVVMASGKNMREYMPVVVAEHVKAKEKGNGK